MEQVGWLAAKPRSVGLDSSKGSIETKFLEAFKPWEPGGISQ